MNASDHSRAVDTDFYEYRGDTFLPIDASVLGREGAALPVFHLATSSSGSDQLSLQGAGSQQSSLQNFYRTSDQQSSLSSSEGVGVSGIPLSESKC